MKNISLLFFLLFTRVDAAVVLSGTLQLYHQVTLTIDGPSCTETGTPNPFLDFRLDVTFTNGTKTYVIPGYFDADGDPGNTGATSGNKWEAIFTPTETGTWSYTISLIQGTNVAISSVASTPAIGDGLTGSFTITGTNAVAPDFRAKGVIFYNNTRYLRHSNGDRFIKGGVDSPENFLGYYGFDNTVDNGGSANSLNGTTSYTSQGNTYFYNGDGLHHFDSHLGDWNTGDPDWGNGKGKRIIGALNYLSESGLNGLDVLTMNINGDGREVYPYISYNGNFAPQPARVRFDCSKLHQWYMVIEHANRKGVFIQFKTQERENDALLDLGQLGTERKVYYRELVARFGSLPGIEWNLGEEYEAYLTINDPNLNVLKACATYFNDLDAYDHNIVAHTWPTQIAYIYSRIQNTSVSGASMQTGFSSVHKATTDWISASKSAGKPWVVCSDEQGPANDGLIPDGGLSNWGSFRSDVLWGNLMAGGGGVNYYFGYGYAHTDLNCESFRSRESAWAQTNIATSFMAAFANLDSFIGADALLSNGYCLAWAKKAYLAYLPSGGNRNINLSNAPGSFLVRWFNPRTGAYTNGNLLSGGSSQQIGNPPSSGDWLAIIELVPPLVVYFEWESIYERDGVVELSWDVITSNGDPEFTILRSTNLIDWYQMDVEIQRDSDRYYAVDTPLVSGHYYYRVSAIDLDLFETSSAIMEVDVISRTRIWASYDSYGTRISSMGLSEPITIMSLRGQAVAIVEPNTTELLEITPGVYVAVADGRAVKFVCR